jgi:hypothetical protein
MAVLVRMTAGGMDPATYDQVSANVPAEIQYDVTELHAVIQP